MFGASRKKQTALWTNIKELQALARTCDDSHEHAAWGMNADGALATAEECAYNAELCAHWASAIEKFAERVGLEPSPHTLDAVVPENLHLKDKANRAFLGALPRGSKLPPLLTDFLDEISIPMDQHAFLAHATPGARLPDNSIFPKGARLIEILNDQLGKSMSFARIGLPVPPLEYLARACGLVHPNLQKVKLSLDMERAAKLCGPGMSVALRRHRIKWTKDMVAIAEASKAAEQELEGQRPEHLRSVLKGKKFAVMHEALKSVDYEDASVALEASNGFPLVGWMKCSGVFASNIRPPSLHVDSLDAMAASFSARTIASVKPSGDDKLDAEVWDATLSEVSGGTLDGPYEVGDLPAGHIVSPRFGIRQGVKTRPIDNLSASGLNSTVGLPERLQVDTIDEIATVVKHCMQTHGPQCRLVGRTYDLKKAYRQLGVSAEHYRFSWIAAWSPEHGRVMLFRMKGLPFGGTASVASFLRMSRALKELGIRGAGLIWSSFFDDFVCVCRPEDAVNTDLTIRFLFRACGWVLSEDPDKDVGFSEVFNALGVQFDLSAVSQGILRVGNTEKRKKELKAIVEGCLEADFLSPEESESLRSRLMFAESQIFGRTAKLALRAIGSPALDGRASGPLSDHVRFGLEWMLRRIVTAPPREISSAPTETLLLFVDGACEPSAQSPNTLITSVGAVLVDMNGRGLKFFGMHLPDFVTGVWAAGGRKNLVFEAEILPYALALECWAELMRDRHVIIFIDNDGARHGWISAMADSKHARLILHKGTLSESLLSVTPFFSRVPTASNLADGPSRLSFELCWRIGAEQTVIPENVLRTFVTRQQCAE
eukprot:s23_g51.t1